jgi:hypothetical protein
MNQFWGYAGADVLAVIVLGGLSILCLVCARLFVGD